MYRTPLGRMSVSLLAFVLIGCASSLELSRDVAEPEVSDLRAIYFKSFPNSPYMTLVRQGEVVAGMDMFGVLASWGPPVTRSRDDPEIEQWVYYDVDPNSGDATEFSLAFTAGVLNGWKTRIHRKVAQGGYRPEHEPLTTVNPAAPPAGKRVPKD